MLSFDKFIEIIDRQQESNILIAAMELNIFTVLNKDGLTAIQVSKKANIKLDGTVPLLYALLAMGAISKKKGLFFNTSESYKHFCAHSKDFKKGTIMLRLNNRREWDSLIKTVREGRNSKEYEGEDEPEFRRLFTYAMHERSESLTGPTSEFIARSPVGHLLDIGAGPGSYSIAVLKRDKNARAVLIDRPAALYVAKKIANSMKLTCRLKFLEGDLFDIDYGVGYQTVLFSNILHIYNDKQNKFLFKKIYNSLDRGGRLIVGDLFLEENRIRPYETALFSLTMLLYTANGKTYSFMEIKDLLKAAGFHRFKRHKMDGGNYLIEGIKK
tara:strand:- start:2795 stop:3775 length:981 start_codon:yes stop_codon:yes gene_type:complete